MREPRIDPPRRRRRAVGPAGSRPAGPELRPDPEPRRPGNDDGTADDGTADDGTADDERFLADRPPHHDQDRL